MTGDRVGFWLPGRRAGCLIGLACALLLPCAAKSATTSTKSPRPQEKSQERPQDSRERLKEVQRELGREREQAKEAGRKEATLSRDLAQIEADLKIKTKLLKDLEAKLRGSTQRIASLSREIDSTEKRLSRTRTLLKLRLRAMYKQDRVGYVRMLLSADDFSSASRRLKYLSALAAQDQRLMQAYAVSLNDLSKKKADFEQYKKDVSEASQQAEATRRQIVDQQQQHRVLLAKVRDEKAAHLAAIKELEKSAKGLQALIARLQADEERQRRASRATSRETARTETRTGVETPIGDSQFERLRGKLPWPAAGTLASTFGRQEHPRFQTVTFNRGIEITAPAGRDIQAVADGTIIFADWFKGYGRLVILDHGGGYFTLYAHAADLLVKTGDTVTAGQTIAKVGDTGSLEGPQLYFELRYRGKPQDPLAWLQPR